MITKYVASSWRIEKKQFAYETAAFLVRVNGMRDKKETSYIKHFDSYAEARAYRIKLHEKEFANALQQCEYAKKELEEARSIPENEP